MQKVHLTFSGNNHPPVGKKTEFLAKKSFFYSEVGKISKMWWVTETQVYRKRLILKNYSIFKEDNKFFGD